MTRHISISVVMTVRNDPDGSRMTLDSLARQSRPANEIIVVDGGSTDGTLDMLHAIAERRPNVRVVSAPGANIAAGRNIATRAAAGDIIAVTDAGCLAAPDWLEKLVRPFESDPSVEFVAGFYRIETRTLFETVVGLATMRGQLQPVDEAAFNPSGRSMAYRKEAWLRAGGWPEWLRYSEDTLFDHKMRQLGVTWRFVADAVVSWRPRRTFAALARQFYLYGTGRGHTQIGAADFAYNIRNTLICALLAGLSVVSPLALPLLITAAGYFYGWTFHDRAVRIAQATKSVLAYPMTLAVMWVVLFSNVGGYLVGSWQRWRSRGVLEESMLAYMAA